MSRPWSIDGTIPSHWQAGDGEQAALVERGLRVGPDVRGVRDVLDAGRRTQPPEVGGAEPDDLAEAEGDDGEVVAAHAQRRPAEHHAEEHRHGDGDRQHEEERPGEVVDREHAGRVGADEVEADVPEVEQPGVPDDDVEADGDQRRGGDTEHHPAEVDLLGRDDRRPQQREQVEEDHQQDDEGDPGGPGQGGVAPRDAVEVGADDAHHARAFPSDSPSRPEGRTRRMRMRSTKDTTSFHWVPKTPAP